MSQRPRYQRPERAALSAGSSSLAPDFPRCLHPRSGLSCSLMLGLSLLFSLPLSLTPDVVRAGNPGQSTPAARKSPPEPARKGGKGPAAETRAKASPPPSPRSLPTQPLPPAPPALETARAALPTDPARALALTLPLVDDKAVNPSHQQAAARLAGQALVDLQAPALGSVLWLQSLEGRVTAGDAAALFQAALTAFPSPDLTEEAVLTRSAALLDPNALPASAQASARYRRGLALLDEGEPKAAVVELTRVSADHPDWLKARLTMGNGFTMMRRRALALATLQDALRPDGPAGARPTLEQERARLNLARAFYGLGKTAEAASEYQKLPRSSPLWLIGQQELAWAYYRQFLQDDDLPSLNRALGVLHTLTSPFFADAFQPESELLHIQLLFQLCRSVEGSTRMKAFQARYKPLVETLTRAQQQGWGTPEATLEQVLAWRTRVTQTHQLNPPGVLLPPSPPPGLLERFLPRPDLDRLERSLQHLADAERLVQETHPSRLPELIPTLRQGLLDRLGKQKAALKRSVGQGLQRELAAATSTLKELLVQADLFELNLLTAEKELYEAAAAGRLPRVRLQGAGTQSPWPTDRQVWPFEGEYWADELGYYQGAARPTCPETE